MKRVLIVSPKAPPEESADNRRVAQMLPYLQSFGWTPHVVSFDSAVGDLRTARREMSRTAAVPRKSWWKTIGVRSPGFSGAAAMSQVISEWHRESQFDLALFSNTQFELWRIAPVLKQQLGLRYVLDWQDPWVSDYYERHPGAPRPGGTLRYGIVQHLARRWEPDVVRNASGHIAVSSAYSSTLRQRYPDHAAPTNVIPFSFDVGDLAAAATLASPWRPPNCSSRYWAYVGRGGSDMEFAARVILSALADSRRSEPQRYAGLKVYFVGTAYASGERARSTIAPIAGELGVGDLVEEFTQRVPYLDALRFLSDAEALVVPGSDDPGYAASKVVPYLHVARPLLAVFHSQSDVHELLEGQAGVRVFGFSDTGETTRQSLSDLVRTAWMDRDLGHEARSARRLDGLDAVSMSRRVASVLDQAIRAP